MPRLTINDMIEAGYSLLKTLETLKAQDEVWVAEDPENRFVGSLTTNLEHWIECDVYTTFDLAVYLNNC